MSGRVCPECVSLLGSGSSICPSCGAVAAASPRAEPGSGWIAGRGDGTADVGHGYDPGRAAITVAAIAMTIVLVAAVAGIAWARAADSTPVGPAGPVTITGNSWQFVYFGSSHGYLGPSPQTACLHCPQSVAPGATFEFLVQFTNHDGGTNSHFINALGLPAPVHFALNGVTPTLPVLIPPGGTITLSLNLTAPPTPGLYVLNGTVETD